MNKIMKRSLISCLVFVFALSLGIQSTVNVSAKQCDDLVYDAVGGFYTISTNDDLNIMACMINHENPDYTSASYHLINDISLTEVIWIPIGTSLSPFSGTFEGNDYTISHLSITTLDTDGAIIDTATLFEAGFFGTLSNATISDLNFDQVNISLETNTILSESEGTSRLTRIGILAANTKGSSEISGITITDSTITITNPLTEAEG